MDDTQAMIASLSEESNTATAPDPTASQQAAPAASPWAEDEYEIEGGKRIKEPRDMILKRAGMGYHYAQKMNALNQKEEALKGKETEYQTKEELIKKLSRWQEYNDFAEKNPTWWQHVEESWKNKTTGQPGEQEPLNPVIADLQKKLADLENSNNELRSFRDEWSKKQAETQAAAEDKEFQSEFDTVEKEFGVDLWQSDEQGRSLRFRVLEHMKTLGLDGSKPGHVKAAFKDMYFDNLMSRKEESVKEQHAKKLAENRKAGILEISKAPHAKAFNGNVSNYSWNDLSQLALAELRAGKNQ